jgi:hypothetical protein
MTRIGRSLCEPDTGPDHDHALDSATNDLIEIAAFVMETLDEDPAACIPLAASYAVNRAYNEGGMEGVRDLLGHYEAFDKKLRLEARRIAA